MINVLDTKINELKIIEPNIYDDNRGYFFESYNEQEFHKKIGKINFVQDNESKSSYGVLRGLHFQKNKPQGKLVRVVQGKVYDVAVDIRSGSATYGQWEAVILSEENKTQFWVPPGFAHGFLVLSETADFEYKCTDYYDSFDEASLLWNDPDLNIPWPIDNPKLSERDVNALFLSDLKNENSSFRL